MHGTNSTNDGVQVCGLRTKSGSLAKLTAIRRASSRPVIQIVR